MIDCPVKLSVRVFVCSTAQTPDCGDTWYDIRACALRFILQTIEAGPVSIEV